MKETYRVRHGGLMRCCLDAMVAVVEPPKEGDSLRCSYCHDESGMIFRDGAWQWAKPVEDQPQEPPCGQ